MEIHVQRSTKLLLSPPAPIAKQARDHASDKPLESTAPTSCLANARAQDYGPH